MNHIRVPIPDVAGNLVKQRFMDFLMKYYEQYSTTNVIDESLPTQLRMLADYMLQISWIVQNNKSTLFINFNHILEFDFELAEAMELEYYRFDSYLRHAIQELIAIENHDYIFNVNTGQREFFASFYNFSRVDSLRALNTDKIGRLVSISGTVTRSSEVRPELLYGSFLCKKCGSAYPNVEQQCQYTEPPVCINTNCVGSSEFQLVLDKCAFTDWQRIRLQENADEIPAGSMPRCIDIIARNDMVEVAKAGDKIILTGTVVVIPDASARAGETTVATKSSAGRSDYFGDGVQGLKKLGVREMTYKMLFMAGSIQSINQRTGLADAQFQIPSSDSGADGDINHGDGMMLNQMTESEKQDILEIKNTKFLYEKMVNSICPSVFGHNEVKRGILLMLFGGVHKKTKEGISLRGDLNVCIVGDPSCAKSQFLKYVHGFLPRTVYTSGKSSTAAGLTASVVRDAETGDFCVEAGALMLADNGICCIDEFDKMDPYDQVAIHEAMEQQTISITKAGIQATLNARTSILAAANPVFGRYDRSKTLKANVAVSAAIMSRFDLFFVILDECNPIIDEQIARHIVRVHRKYGVEKVSEETPFTREQLQKYIQFARKINPIITPESKKVLVESYRLLRQNDLLGKNKTAYRITVRQLESLVRLSEALARLHLSIKIEPVYVREAYRLLQKSIIFVESQDIELDDIEEELDQLAAEHGERRILRQRKKRNGKDFGHDDCPDDDDEGDDDGLDPDHDGSDPMDIIPPSDARQDTNNESTESTNPIKESSDSSTSNDNHDDHMELPVQLIPSTKSQPKSKSKISAKEYEEISQLLLLRLKKSEEHDNQEAVEGIDKLRSMGIAWKDLVAWYFEQPLYKLNSTEEFHEKKKVLNQIIRRMIKHDGSIIVINDEKNIMNEDKILTIHPSL